MIKVWKDLNHIMKPIYNPEVLMVPFSMFIFSIIWLSTDIALKVRRHYSLNWQGGHAGLVNG